MRRVILSLAALTLAVTPLHARELPPEPPHPNWEVAAEAILDAMRRSFVDPDSIEIEWVSGFAWGYHKPLIGRRKIGWLTCGNVNARNRMGGYAGSRTFIAIRYPDGDTEVILGVYPGTNPDNCYRGKVAVNPELLAASERPKDVQDISVADEIAKLVDLLERGLITDEEFTAAKAKLLER